MRRQFAWHATACALALMLALSPRVGAQQPSAAAAGDRDLNPSARAAPREGAGQPGQNRSQSNSQTETIRGVIAAITAEGEMTLDYRTNTAARTEGAFLTIVGSPAMSWADDSARSSSASNDDQRGRSARRRHNVYIAWLSPRTQITERGLGSAATNRSQRQGEGQNQARNENMPLRFDQLEVGDHVEVQFSMVEDSNASNNVHQNQQMRQKHGRHRTFVGYATSITVLPNSEHDKTSSAPEPKSNEKPNN
jgi:hypothetical protein